MAIFTVSYDLQDPGQSYKELYAAIKELGAAHRAFDSYWLLSTNLDAGQIYDYLRRAMDSNDLLHVDELSSSHRGWLKKTTCDWLNNQSQVV